MTLPSTVLAAALAALLATPVTGLAAVDAVSRRIDRDGPALGAESLDLRELWRVGGEDEDVIFGRIVDVTMDRDGSVYVLDNQLCQVVVVSGHGEVLRTLSRQGDGPGELRQPMGMVLLPGDVLGVGMGHPGQLVTMTLDGAPLSTRYPIGAPADGNVGIMLHVRFVDGVLVASGGRISFQPGNGSHVDRFLAVSDAEGGGTVRILGRTTPIDPTGRVYVEADDYYIDRSWALGPGGTIYAPMERDRYEVSVFDRTGRLLRVFGREDRPRKRTREEKDAITPLINVTGNPESRRWTIADHDPRVTRVVYGHDDDTVWVLTPHGSHDQPAGILETWDVFSADGDYLKQVAIPLGHAMNDGACYLVGGGKLVVVRGTGSAFTGGQQEQDDADVAVEPLEVICYEIR
jgi:hypothetical protein